MAFGANREMAPLPVGYSAQHIRPRATFTGTICLMSLSIMLILMLIKTENELNYKLRYDVFLGWVILS